LTFFALGAGFYVGLDSSDGVYVAANITDAEVYSALFHAMLLCDVAGD